MSDKKTETNKNAEIGTWNEDLLATRRRRARVTAFLLGAFVVLFFLITVVRLGANIVNRPL